MSRQVLGAYPELQQLDKYSAQVAQKIYRYRPQWIPLIEMDETIFRIKLEAPDHSIGINTELIISTQDHRLTVFFDWHHAHFDQFERKSSNKEFARAMAFVEDILNEKLVIVVKMDERQYGLSRLVTPEELGQIDPAGVTYTFSWRGTYSRIYK